MPETEKHITITCVRDRTGQIRTSTRHRLEHMAADDRRTMLEEIIREAYALGRKHGVTKL